MVGQRAAPGIPDGGLAPLVGPHRIGVQHPRLRSGGHRLTQLVSRGAGPPVPSNPSGVSVGRVNPWRGRPKVGRCD